MSLTENNCDEDPSVPPGVAHSLGLRGPPGAGEGGGDPVGIHSANDDHGLI